MYIRGHVGSTYPWPFWLKAMLAQPICLKVKLGIYIRRYVGSKPCWLNRFVGDGRDVHISFLFFLAACLLCQVQSCPTPCYIKTRIEVCTPVRMPTTPSSPCEPSRLRRLDGRESCGGLKQATRNCHHRLGSHLGRDNWMDKKATGTQEWKPRDWTRS